MADRKKFIRHFLSKAIVYRYLSDHKEAEYNTIQYNEIKMTAQVR